MRDTSSAHRSAAVEALFGQICRATPEEARGLSMMLSPAERADLALFCYSRVHTREQARAIATACTRESLFRAGGPPGAALYDQAEAKGDTWGAPAIFAKRPVSLAG